MTVRVSGIRLTGLVVAVAAVATLSAGLAASRPPGVTRAAVAANDGSAVIGISVDGRRVAFYSWASNLPAAPKGRRAGLVVYDRVSGKIQRRVLRPGFYENGGSQPALSPDLRFVAFTSPRPPGPDASFCSYVFALDRVTGKQEQVDLNRKGAPGAIRRDEFCSDDNLAISADGRFVAFTSHASDLVSGDTNMRPDVFVRDLATRATERVSVGSSGRQANGGSGGNVAISADGRRVYFSSTATNLAGDRKPGLFVHDRRTKVTRRLLPIPPVNGVFSAEDRVAAFSLNRRTRNGGWFAKLFAVGRTDRRELLPVTKSGAWANGPLTVEGISSDGRYVVFSSTASNLTSPSSHTTCVRPPEYNPYGQIRDPGSRGPCPDLYVIDRRTGTTELITVRRPGTAAVQQGTSPFASYLPSFDRSAFVSADGRFIAFTSTAVNLVAGRDTNHRPDVFLRDRKKHTTTLISAAG